MTVVKKLQEFRVSLLYLEYDARALGMEAVPVLLAAARKEVEDAISETLDRDETPPTS